MTCLGMVCCCLKFKRRLEHGSTVYNEFLSILGNTVPLKGFSGFKAGLDTEHGNTGQETINTKWRDFEVTYHVSTMLPYIPSDEQHIQRKRHIGNGMIRALFITLDLVCIVFLDGPGAQFDPTCVASQFLHIYIVVKPETLDGIDGYRVIVAQDTHVPEFGPSLPTHGVFLHPSHLRHFLLAKSKCVLP